jgi:hypothetical protein
MVLKYNKSNSSLTEYPDKLGCYRVNGLKFYSKLEAIDVHSKTGIHPHWDFNEAVFNSYDWTKEPETSLQELYQQRAQQLREKYDYIVLMFSGGADSTNVLKTFINNDIKIDEVVSYMAYESNRDKDAFFNAEIFRVSIPLAEQLKIEYPWLKHRVIDLTEFMAEHFKKKNNKFEWIYDMNSCFSPNNSCKESLPLKIKEWADIIHSGKKFCVLWAHDKPRIWHVDGRFLFRFIDVIDNAATVKSISGKQPYTDELFYWTPDLPEILIKQGHVIKQYLSQPNVEKLPFVSKIKSDLAFKQVNGVNYWLSNHGVHSLIYPGWNIKTFTNGKASSAIFTERDSWFFNLSKTLDIRKNFFDGLDVLWQMIPDYWKNNPADIKEGIKGCWSRDYFLEK